MTEQEFIHQFCRPLAAPAAMSTLTNQQPATAAVLVPVVKRNCLTLLFTERAHHLRHHPGQICFPGGKHDVDDPSLYATALREAQEEVGILANKVTIVGELPILTSSSGFAIKPMVGLVEPKQYWHANEDEVADVFEVPVSHFLQQNNYHIQYIYRKKQRHQVCFVPWNNRLIWGITGNIVYQLKHYLS